MINSILIIIFLEISIDFVLICSYYNDIQSIEPMEADEISKVEGAFADSNWENSYMLGYCIGNELVSIRIIILS